MWASRLRRLQGPGRQAWHELPSLPAKDRGRVSPLQLGAWTRAHSSRRLIGGERKWRCQQGGSQELVLKLCAVEFLPDSERCSLADSDFEFCSLISLRGVSAFGGTTVVL